MNVDLSFKALIAYFKTIIRFHLREALHDRPNTTKPAVSTQ